ncbi:uncharacterized protein CTHT_0012120 [Thermochaetoides thermophila DSM 1495]|uniref:BZIP domain-containing protein n=1 Tax=Chaetomium thermophilum (strain DSM 1495 / CBS 144.50 / IMI 039719) TaxID=759272 RepID=G0S127_CHATD|nr:hypothetical protein CTHT_0012120 [Thermochaetoides thermophila DSM 1495]EGS22737.1 hypothetical protein CTHT_0012120 [Thermochaetoides thermophila DSM 1495]
MDYTNAAYFPGAPPYQFMGAHAGIPPLTPAPTNSVASVASDEFTTTSSPEVYDQFTAHGLPPQEQQLPNFNAGYAPFNPTQPFPGPPTPPGQHPAAAVGAAGVVHPVGNVNGVNGAVHHPAGPTSGILAAVPKKEIDEQQASSRKQGSSDEDLTPAQSRRKAQNRAAQRAFRERKERHVKDLENRVQQLEQAQQEALSENERLKRDLQKISTENEILKATTSMVAASAGSPNSNAAPTTTGPMQYSPTDFYSNVLQSHANKTPSHRIVLSENGERLLAAGATWEFIINHELFKKGLVDLAKVSEILRPQAKCDGQGPVFEERAIVEAIQQSVASGSDELL